jgi:hypothetical protein
LIINIAGFFFTFNKALDSALTNRHLHIIYRCVIWQWECINSFNRLFKRVVIVLSHGSTRYKARDFDFDIGVLEWHFQFFFGFFATDLLNFKGARINSFS